MGPHHPSGRQQSPSRLHYIAVSSSLSKRHTPTHARPSESRLVSYRDPLWLSVSLPACVVFKYPTGVYQVRLTRVAWCSTPERPPKLYGPYDCCVKC